MTYSISIWDYDRRRHAPLAEHAGLSLEDAHELQAIYEALGYPCERIRIEAEVLEEVAA